MARQVSQCTLISIWFSYENVQYITFLYVHILLLEDFREQINGYAHYMQDFHYYYIVQYLYKQMSSSLDRFNLAVSWLNRRWGFVL